MGSETEYFPFFLKKEKIDMRDHMELFNENPKL